MAEPSRRGAGRLEQLRQEVGERLAPEAPHVGAVGLLVDVLDAGLLERLDERAVLLQQEIVLADADPEQARVLVEGGGVLGQRLHVRLGAAGRGAERAEVGVAIRVAQADVQRLAAAHRQAGEGAAGARRVDAIGLLDQRLDLREEIVLEHLEGLLAAALLALLRPIGVAVGHDDEHRHHLAVGEQVVGDHVGAAQCAQCASLSPAPCSR